MMKNNINLQDIFLNQARKEKTPVMVLLNGNSSLKGFVRGFDSFTVILECEGKQTLIYKHAIMTIVPQHAIEMGAAAGGADVND